MNSPSIQTNVITVQLPTLSLHSAELEALLERAALRGAQQALEAGTCYNYKEASKRLNISPDTLRKRILEGKIATVDGLISGAEIHRYLTQKRGY